MRGNYVDTPSWPYNRSHVDVLLARGGQMNKKESQLVCLLGSSAWRRAAVRHQFGPTTTFSMGKKPQRNQSTRQWKNLNTSKQLFLCGVRTLAFDMLTQTHSIRCEYFVVVVVVCSIVLSVLNVSRCGSSKQTPARERPAERSDTHLLAKTQRLTVT